MKRYIKKFKENDSDNIKEAIINYISSKNIVGGRIGQIIAQSIIEAFTENIEGERGLRQIDNALSMIVIILNNYLKQIK